MHMFLFKISEKKVNVKLPLKNIVLVVGIMFLCACDDILERDISMEKIRVLLPVQNSSVRSAEVTFQWEEVAGGRSYRMLLASPSLQRPTKFYLDTITTSSSLLLPLQPGDYEWKVQALNAGYKTGFTIQSFEVDSATNLSGAQVRLQNPGQMYFSNSNKINFTWTPVDLADKYLLEIRGSGIKKDTIVYTVKVPVTLLKADGEYRWQVKALNATGIVSSQIRTFYLDFTAPAEPKLLYPSPDTIVHSWPVTLRWQPRDQDVMGDSLFLYLSDRQTLVNGFPKKLLTSTFQLTSGLSLAPGEYFWTVKSYDRANNGSDIPPVRMLIVR